MNDLKLKSHAFLGLFLTILTQHCWAAASYPPFQALIDAAKPNETLIPPLALMLAPSLWTCLSLLMAVAKRRWFIWILMAHNKKKCCTHHCDKNVELRVIGKKKTLERWNEKKILD
jgi:hypothetical protein